MTPISPDASNRRDSSPPALGHAHYVHIPASVFLVLIGIAVVPWLWLALHFRSEAPASPTIGISSNHRWTSSSGIEVRVGPWGELESLEVILMPTEELIPPGWSGPRPVEWFFAGHTEVTLAEWLRGLPLSPAHRTALADARRWRHEADGVIVQVPDDVVVGLDSFSRAAIYRLLLRDPRNRAHNSPWSLRTNMWPAACVTAGISDPTRQTLERVAHYEQGRLFVADVFAVLNQTSSYEEKSRIVRLTSSASARLLRLRIRPDSNLNDLILYWARGVPRKDLRPIFEALKAMPNGGTLDIIYLLPAFARQRVFTYPYPSQNNDGVHRDCHWTSLNFFSIVPDDRLGDASYAQEHILQQYFPVGEAPLFGDVLFLSRPDGSVIHSAVYLAADYVFTKNGDSVQQPWTIMDLKELKGIYSVLAPDGLRVQFWRNREYEN